MLFYPHNFSFTVSGGAINIGGHWFIWSLNVVVCKNEIGHCHVHCMYVISAFKVTPTFGSTRVGECV